MAEANADAIDPVSAFFREEQPALVAAGAAGRVLDLACGRGRHALAAAALGLEVLAVDRNAGPLAELAAAARVLPGRIETLAVDLERDEPPELPGAPFSAILVFRYLHRPLAPAIASWLAPGGLLLYETFTVAQRTFGWGPTRDAFLLEPGELPRLFPGLTVERFEEGPTAEPRPAFTARLRARRPPADHGR
ncbi:MAG: class I SAM-dependent methyltransferase [Myxococcota bacterium]